MADTGPGRILERFLFGQRIGSVKPFFQPRITEHGLPVFRQYLQHGGQQFFVERYIILQMVETVVPLAEFTDKAALEYVNHIAVGPDEGGELFQMF